MQTVTSPSEVVMTIIIKQSIVALFTGVLVLLLGGCEMMGEQDKQKHRFSFEILDENGELLRQVTHERVGGVEIETSLGLFGDNFLPPRSAAELAERLGIEPDELRKHAIYLHAENSSREAGEEVHFLALNFSFPGMEHWESGTYRVSASITIDRWLEALRNIWELRQEQREGPQAKQGPPLYEKQTDMEEPSMDVNFTERVFGSQGESHLSTLYLPTGGHMELEEVSGDNVAGNFSLDMAGLPAEILSADEFPEDPEIRNYRITGNFVAEYGDYQDFERAHVSWSWTFGG